jgi:ribonuclease Y
VRSASTPRPATSRSSRRAQAARGALAARKAELEDVAEERRLILERTAGMTAEQSKAELVASIEGQAKREAAVLVRDLEARRPRGGGQPGPQDRHPRDPAGRQRADRRVGRQRAAPAERRHEGPHHRPRRAQHPRLRVGHRRQPDHRRHARGGPALELRSGAPRDRADRAGGSRPRRAIHPHRIEEVYERARPRSRRQCIRAGEDAVVGLGITEMHPDLIALLGRLRYRTSYGQNVLKHLVESAHLAG